ncbi:MAG TPA: RNA polymerase sigma factor [Thermoanaerobaculia bacterium]|jgi:RNA polymerase sigma-70 factor (ECF subfamily)|nr:RNA polymerase sigma factor [Thermoanaerobaculia bacterium]
MNELSDVVKDSWHRFLDLYEPLRPELYRYCRYLTRSPWDAEDLVQDTMARAFVTLGQLFKEPPNPRAWLFRVASNLWIDRVRRMREVPTPLPEIVAPPETRIDRDAAGTLIARLSPQERAAVVLKDVFDLTLAEIAEALSTTAGAVKTALHRGRGKLAESEPIATRAPAPNVLNAFCDAFNARDLDRMTALLLETATVKMVGLVTEYGRDAPRDPETGSFYGMLYSDLSSDDPRGGVARELRRGVLPTSPRLEMREHRDEPILLFWYAHEDGDAVRAVARVETDGDALAGVHNYFFNPDVIAEVCGELDVPYRVNGYRYWLEEGE